MKRIILACVFASLLAIPEVSEAQEPSFIVIGNPSTTPDAISKRDLSRIFLKTRNRWPDGQAAEPVDQGGSGPLRAAFSQEVLDRSLDMVESHWQAQVFAGRGTPPTTLDSDAAVLDFVRRTPGAVGYVSAGAATNGVKVITVQ